MSNWRRNDCKVKSLIDIAGRVSVDRLVLYNLVVKSHRRGSSFQNLERKSGADWEENTSGLHCTGTGLVVF